MYASDDTLMVYYCGDVLNDWHFEGFLVMSRTFELNPDREADVLNVLVELEITDDEMCRLSPEKKCPAPTAMETMLEQ